MVKAPIPPDEDVRLQDLYEYGILDTPAAQDFDDLVKLASDLCKAPISLITLVDANRQWFKATTGQPISETPRDISFCGHAMLNGEIFVVPDALKDQRFHDNPIVTGHPNIRFYAGVPLTSPHGARLGTLCIQDHIPRSLTKEHRDILITLGRQVVRLLELHKKNRELALVSAKETALHKEGERVSDMQKRIISILAHDIRGPLNSLKGMLALIPESQGPVSQPGRVVEVAANQLNATLSLLDNMVEWGQLGLKGETLDNRDFNLHKLVSESFGELKIQAERKGLALRSRVTEDVTIRSDEYRMRFILRNLLTNAIKFTKSGHITIDAALSAKNVHISVEDTGIGMPAPILEQLFYGCKRIARKGTQNESGSGLGLSLVKEFTEKMNGTITAESEPGKGCSIALTLPR